MTYNIQSSDQDCTSYPIDDQDLVELELEAQLFGRHGHRVEETEAHGLGSLGVVARRPHHGKAILELAGSHFEGQLDDRA